MYLLRANTELPGCHFADRCKTWTLQKIAGRIILKFYFEGKVLDKKYLQILVKL